MNSRISLIIAAKESNLAIWNAGSTVHKPMGGLTSLESIQNICLRVCYRGIAMELQWNRRGILLPLAHRRWLEPRIPLLQLPTVGLVA